jgi:hypothetical protein
MDYSRWAKRKATRPSAGLVPVEVDVHTDHGVIRAIRYHRAEDAKKLVAEGKARQIKEMRTKTEGEATPAKAEDKGPTMPDRARLPSLVGSEKQIKWASDVRENHVSALEKLGGVHPDAKVFSDALLSHTQAKFWIDNRSAIGGVSGIAGLIADGQPPRSGLWTDWTPGEGPRKTVFIAQRNWSTTTR